MTGALVYGWWILQFCFSRLEKGDELILIGKLDLRDLMFPVGTINNNEAY